MYLHTTHNQMGLWTFPESCGIILNVNEVKSPLKIFHRQKLVRAFELPDIASLPFPLHSHLAVDRKLKETLSEPLGITHKVS